MPLTLLDRLNRRFGRLAIPNLTVLLIAGQALLYIAARLPQGISLYRITLQPERVLQGEVWRLVTFLFAPPQSDSVFVIFYFMLFYLFGTSLETHWGAFRYNVFLLIGYVANVAGAFLALAAMHQAAAPAANGDIVAHAEFSNTFLYGSIFLAFARLYPDFIINVFFILPIRIKWLALLQWLGYLSALLTGNWMTRMAVLASVLNYLIFFGAGHWRQVKQLQRRQEFQIKAKKAAAAPRHVCAVCGATSDDSPRRLFRYCSKCAGQRCYCPDHIHDHVHVTEEPTTA
jgi:hypothetical protein